MVCLRPFAGLFGCGQCRACRIRLRRFKTGRGLLESFVHNENSFVTCTYEQDCLPEGGNLRKKDGTGFIKRLRESVPFEIRYFGCGEYGEPPKPIGGGRWTEGFRPHFHLILFGYPTCHRPPGPHVSRYEKCQCPPCVTVQKAWDGGRDMKGKGSRGFTDLRRAERRSIQYVSGYVTQFKTKKYAGMDGLIQVHKQFPEIRRTPEFPLFSNRPGIGANAMRNIADALTTDQGAMEILKLGDVPPFLKMGGKKINLDRYMKFKLRQFYGFPERKTIRGSVNNSPEETQLRDAIRRYYEREVFEVQRPGEDYAKFKKAERLQKVLNIETRDNIFSQNRSV